MSKPTCAGTRRDGEPCGAVRYRESQYCFAHQPAKTAAMAQASAAETMRGLDEADLSAEVRGFFLQVMRGEVVDYVISPMGTIEEKPVSIKDRNAAAAQLARHFTEKEDTKKKALTEEEALALVRGLWGQ